MRSKQEKIISVCIMAGVFAVAAFLCRPVFYLNDDVTMRSILSGSYTGTPDGHAIYMNYPLTGMLKFLYGLTDRIYWMEMFFAGCLIWPIAEIVMDIKSKRKGMLWEVLLGILFVLPFFWYMHYTIIAAVLAGTAAFLLCTGQKGMKPAVFWLLSWMIRSQVAYLAAPFLGVALLWKILGAGQENRKEKVREIGKAGIFTLACLILCMGINSLAYADEDWQMYLKYNAARTELYDYTNFHSTDYYRDNFEQYGMTEAEFLVLDSYNTMLDVSVNVGKMSDIAGRVTEGMIESRDNIVWLKECIQQYYYQIRYGENLYTILWFAMFAGLMLLLVLGRNWLGTFLTVCLGGGRSLIWIFLIYRGRFPERIIISLYVIELFLLAGMLWNLPAVCRKNLESIKQKLAEKWKIVPRICIVCQMVFLLGGICILTGQLKMYNPRIQAQADVQREWDVLKEYCEKNEETLYLLDVFSTVEYGGFQYEKDPTNLMLAGGWMSASPLAAQRFADLGAVDAGQALYENSQVAFLVEKGKNIAWLEKHLMGRFGECTLQQVAEIPCSENKVFVEYRVIK